MLAPRKPPGSRTRKVPWPTWDCSLMSWHELGTDSPLTGGITPFFRVIVTHVERGRGGTSPPTSSTWSHRRSPTGELHSAALSGCLRAQCEERIAAGGKKKRLSHTQTYTCKNTNMSYMPYNAHFSCAQQMINTSTFTYTCKLSVSCWRRTQSPFILPPHHTPREVCWPCPFFMQQCLILKKMYEWRMLLTVVINCPLYHRLPPC